MKKGWHQLFILGIFFLSLSLNAALAEELYVYPAKGQSQDLIKKEGLIITSATRCPSGKFF